MDKRRLKRSDEGRVTSVERKTRRHEDVEIFRKPFAVINELKQILNEQLALH